MQIQNHLQNISLNEWSVYDVASWLSFNNISKDIINNFILAEINGSVLKELGESAVKEIEIYIPCILTKLHALISDLVQYNRSKSPAIESLSPAGISVPSLSAQKNCLPFGPAQISQIPPMNFLVETKLANCNRDNTPFINKYVQYLKNKPVLHEIAISKRLISPLSAYENSEEQDKIKNCTQLTQLSDSIKLQAFQNLEIIPANYITNTYKFSSKQVFDSNSQHIEHQSMYEASLKTNNDQQRYIQRVNSLETLLPSSSNNSKLKYLDQAIKEFQISEINKLLENFHETWKYFLCPSLKKKFSLDDEDFELMIKKLDQSICRYRVFIWIKDLITVSETDLSESLSNSSQTLTSMSEDNCDSDCIWSQSNIEELLNIPLVHISQRESFKKIIEKCQAKTPNIQLNSPDIIASILVYLKNNDIFFQTNEFSQTYKHHQNDENRSEICTSCRGIENFNSNNLDLLLNNQSYQKNISRAEICSESLTNMGTLKDEELIECSSQCSSELSNNIDIKTLQSSRFSNTPRQLSSSIYSSENNSGSTQSLTSVSTSIPSSTPESSPGSYKANYFSTALKRFPSEKSVSSSASNLSNSLVSKRTRKPIESCGYPISKSINHSYESPEIQNSNNNSKVYYQDSRPSYYSSSSNKNRKNKRDGCCWKKSCRVSNQVYIHKTQFNELINKQNSSDSYCKSTCESSHIPSFSFKEILKFQRSSLPKQRIVHSRYKPTEDLSDDFIRIENQILSPFSNYLNTSISIKALALNLKPHQISGIEFLWKTIVEKGHGAILAHAMGLGKTGQVFTFLNTLSYYIQFHRNIISNILQQFKILILAPASLQENWINEFQKWTNFEDPSISSSVYLPMPISLGETPTRQRIYKLNYWAKNGGILILSHTLFKNCVQNKDRYKKQFEDILINQPGASLVIIDEAHVLKKEDTLIRKISKEFKTPARIMLTGYPMQNSLTEYWCMSKFANDSIFGSLQNFKIEYKYPINKGFYEPLGSRLRKQSDKVLYKLSKLLQPIVHRVNSDVIKDQIPKKVEYAVCCYLSPIQYTLYKYYIDLFNSELNKIEFLEKGCLLQAICNIPIHKDLIFSPNTCERFDTTDEDSELESIGSMHMKILLERMRNLSENSSDIKNNPKFFILTELIQESLLIDEKMIVFSRSIKSLLAIQKWLKLFTSQKTLLLTGQTIMEDRQYYINCINQDDEYKILLASVSVGGVGFTVTGATRVIIYDIGYNPTVIDQAIARSFRIGQTKNVHVYRLYTFDTWEARLEALSEHKNNLILRTMDSRNSDIDRVDLKEMKKYFKLPEYRRNGEHAINREDSILRKVFNSYKDFIATCIIHRDEPTEHKFDVNEAEKRAIEVEVEFEMEAIGIFNE